MTHSERYREKAAALTATANSPSNFSLRWEYEYIAAVYLRLAEQEEMDALLDGAVSEKTRPCPSAVAFG
jgi:hypothetical protein